MWIVLDRSGGVNTTYLWDPDVMGDHYDNDPDDRPNWTVTDDGHLTANVRHDAAVGLIEKYDRIHRHDEFYDDEDGEDEDEAVTSPEILDADAESDPDANAS